MCLIIRDHLARLKVLIFDKLPWFDLKFYYFVLKEICSQTQRCFLSLYEAEPDFVIAPHGLFHTFWIYCFPIGQLRSSEKLAYVLAAES